ncbi:hypothetical protein BCR33DRAFT_723410 [Rhizoclosmatium globosum]|uniref:Uncharacterized protein n=1 Tax=Rhizoclosmatium globosum TaxID=329046 RepID=A0A1Y2BD45_9FUNG|nr:hypothetical protein BCR33DRAFT_723410 [Rhizoclosmatium globosum]|eukprot:ORY32758.1 hypothetical protein BCR33DRAFT_723410 [Rhizoclosmatium globosum]
MKSKSSANGGGGGVGKKKVDESVASGSGGGVWMNKMTEVESGIVKPIDVGDVKLEGGGGEDDGGVEKTYVSFAVTEWDRRNGTLFIHQISPRSAYQPTADSYRDLLKATIRHIQSDAEYRQFPPLKHIWCWTRTSFHSRLRGIPERMGFIPLNEYLAKERLANETGRALFDSDGKEVLRDDGAVVFGCRVDIVLK